MVIPLCGQGPKPSGSFPVDLDNSLVPVAQRQEVSLKYSGTAPRFFANAKACIESRTGTPTQWFSEQSVSSSNDHAMLHNCEPMHCHHTMMGKGTNTLMKK